ncbi:pyridoxal phosphate-dependent aminotransferase [Thermococcus sp. M39]|uniref:pyridoxal phosphate-dependent aminotransferase n=1 Tax=unclassified Thermococcus TaxID=2627626 RepID=UPI00143AB05E|nr:MULTISPECIES: pyridoxal phosphate-dependent aminotransferase [unclassified Thermococcus]NJE07853.1 pyridoxal phosphate-dependent aminotransferase [Thermococcus sp. M39]NJE13436.1 pyridoxal phosphate-dependent aminotransferase [Thermococcus sp. LS2]
MEFNKLKDLSKIWHDYGTISVKGNFVDCSLGVNPFGCSPKVLEVFKNISLEEISNYPKRDDELKKAIEEYWNHEVVTEEIFLGTGSMGCLQKINKLLREGSVVLGYSPQFVPYINDAVANGAIYEYVPLKQEKNFEIDVGEIINALNDKTAFIYVDNPNNPTGQAIRLKDLEELVEEAERKNAIVIVDEAYGEFMPMKNSAINLNYENLIVVRSFSKGFGLAGLRIGYCIVKGKALRELIAKVDTPFSVTSLSAKAAIEALEDRNFVKKTVKEIRKRKVTLLRALKREFHIAKTSDDTPIFLCGGKEDTHAYFLERGILTVPGNEFINLDNSYVRIRVPKNVEEFLRRLLFV